MSEATVDCVRCGQTAAPHHDIPYGGAIGEEIREKICAACWEEWLKAEVMTINELRLNFMDPEAQKVLSQQMRQFLMLGDPS